MVTLRATALGARLVYNILYTNYITRTGTARLTYGNLLEAVAGAEGKVVVDGSGNYLSRNDPKLTGIKCVGIQSLISIS